jgi:hypothetical protein
VRATLAALAATVLVAAACGSQTASPQPTSATPAQAKSLLTARLHAKQLSFRWVACIRNGRSYRAARIVRCNVNFGDPHIEAYCSVLVGGRLVTDHENAAIPCRHDDAGWAGSTGGS